MANQYGKTQRKLYVLVDGEIMGDTGRPYVVGVFASRTAARNNRASSDRIIELPLTATQAKMIQGLNF